MIGSFKLNLNSFNEVSKMTKKPRTIRSTNYATEACYFLE